MPSLLPASTGDWTSYTWYSAECALEHSCCTHCRETAAFISVSISISLGLPLSLWRHERREAVDTAIYTFCQMSRPSASPDVYARYTAFMQRDPETLDGNSNFRLERLHTRRLPRHRTHSCHSSPTARGPQVQYKVSTFEFRERRMRNRRGRASGSPAPPISFCTYGNQV